MSSANPLTPAPGPDASLTPDAGPAAGATPDNATEPSRPAPETETETERVKQRLAGSTREANRLLQENLQLRQLIAAYQNQPAKPAETAQPTGDSELYGEFTDGVIERNPAKVEKFARHLREQAKREVMTELATEGGKANRRQSSLAYVAQEIGANPQSPLAVAAVKRYGEIVNDPSYSWVENDEVAFAGGAINPHKLRLAITEAKAQLGAGIATAERTATMTNDVFVEAATKPKVSDKKTVNYDKHLSKEERAYCDRSGMSYERFWKYMDQGVKSSRLQQGRAVNKRGQPLD